GALLTPSAGVTLPCRASCEGYQTPSRPRGRGCHREGRTRLPLLSSARLLPSESHDGTDGCCTRARKSRALEPARTSAASAEAASAAIQERGRGARRSPLACRPTSTFRSDPARPCP